MPDPKELRTITGVYNGTPITQRGDFLNLTDMWKATGSTTAQQPAKWQLLPEAQSFHSHLLEYLNVRKSDILSKNGKLIIAVRGRTGGTWAHWQLGLTYAQYLDPDFHIWCNEIVSESMRQHIITGSPPYEGKHRDLVDHIDRRFDRLSRQLDETATDQMSMTIASGKRDLIGERLPFTLHSKKIIHTVILDEEEYEGRCPCCRRRLVLDSEGNVLNKAEYDHFFHNRRNKPEDGWLICKVCHEDLTLGGQLARTNALPAFREFRNLVHERRLRRVRDGRR